MNYSRFLLAVVLVLATAGVAHATPVDPSAVIGGGIGSMPVGTTFTLTTMGGDDFFTLNNNAAGTFIGLQLIFNVTVPLPAGSLFSCSGGGFFASCTVPSDPSLPSTGPFSFLYSGGPGIPVGFDFSLSIGGWGLAPNITTIQGIASIANVPEPATITLMLLGVGAVGLRRKLISA